MGRVELVFDPEQLQFSIPVLIAHIETGALETAEFLVDTGSNGSSLSESTARKVGIRPELLKSELVGGVGGYTQEPVYRGTLTLYLNENLDQVLIRDPRVFLPITRKVKKRSMGRVVAQRIVEAPVPNLFGMDALRSINGEPGVLTIDLRSGSGVIEW